MREEDLDNLLGLLGKNPGWSIMLEEEKDEGSLELVRNISWACSVYMWGVQMMAMVWRLAWVIMGILVSLLMYQLLRQATNFLYQQHQWLQERARGGPPASPSTTSAHPPLRICWPSLQCGERCGGVYRE